MNMIKRKKKTPQQIKENQEKIQKRNEFFEKIWKSRPHICEITGVKLYNPINSMYFHHILPKSKYPEAWLDEENIILLHPNIHAQAELDMYRYEEINKRREKLLKKYGYS